MNYLFLNLYKVYWNFKFPISYCGLKLFKQCKCNSKTSYYTLQKKSKKNSIKPTQKLLYVLSISRYD